MKVLLTKDVPSLGRAGEVKEVSDGYARNFLINRHLALPATAEVLDRVQKEQTAHQAKVAKDHERFLKLKHKLEHKTFTIKAKAEKNSLFAAIHERQIATLLSEAAGIEISPETVRLEKPVKSLGKHQAEIRFAKNLTALVNLEVIAL